LEFSGTLKFSFTKQTQQVEEWGTNMGYIITQCAEVYVYCKASWGIKGKHVRH